MDSESSTIKSIVEAVQKAEPSSKKSRSKNEAKRERNRIQHLKNIQKTLTRHPEDKKNFFRILTHDQCSQRHHILEPGVLEAQCPLDNGRHDSPEALTKANPSSLGALDKLPIEILHQIFYDHTALSTLTRCRAVNRGLRMVIDNIPQYKAMVTNAPSILRAIISLWASRLTSLPDIYDALTSKECTTCGKFGAFLWVPNCLRVCYNCFTTDNNYLPIKWTHAQQKYMVKPAQLYQYGASTIKTIPGSYEKDSRKRQRARLDLVPIYDAGLVGGLVHGSISEMFELADEKEEERWEKYDAKVLLWEATPENERTGRAPALPPFANSSDSKHLNPYRFMCIVGLPWLDRSRGVLEWGVACNGCKITYGKLAKMKAEGFKDYMDNANILYSEDEYLEHFMKCKDAQDILLRSPPVRGPEVRVRSVCNVVGDASAREPGWAWKKCVLECPIPPRASASS